MENSEIKKENLEWYLSQTEDMQYEMCKNFIDIAKLY